jgi:hypothetical protein
VAVAVAAEFETALHEQVVAEVAVGIFKNKFLPLGSLQ